MNALVEQTHDSNSNWWIRSNHYQWQQSADGSTGWANSTGTGATTATYTPSSAVPGTTYYRVLVNAANNGCDQAVSNNAVAVYMQIC
jgi:hypothetical protein